MGLPAFRMKPLAAPGGHDGHDDDDLSRPRRPLERGARPVAKGMPQEHPRTREKGKSASAPAQGQARPVDQRSQGVSRLHAPESDEQEDDLLDRHGRPCRQDLGIPAQLDAGRLSARERPSLSPRDPRPAKTGPSAAARARPGESRSSTGTASSSGTSSSTTTSSIPITTPLKMPNGNVLMVVWDKKTAAEAIAAGRKKELVSDYVLPDSIVEVKPTGKTTGEVVWEWHLWDHLVQDHDSTKANYGDVAAHPELVDINFVESSLGGRPRRPAGPPPRRPPRPRRRTRQRTRPRKPRPPSSSRSAMSARPPSGRSASIPTGPTSTRSTTTPSSTRS